MGSRGPVPKRSGERAGHRTKAEAAEKVPMAGPVTVPPAAHDWAPEARRWYRSLAQSGQSRYYEGSDWEYARLLARLLTTQLQADRPSSEMVKAILAGMAELGTTEGARRRMRIEVERPDPEDTAAGAAEVAVLEQYRRVSGK